MMSGKVLESWTAWLAFPAGLDQYIGGLLRSASESMGGTSSRIMPPIVYCTASGLTTMPRCGMINGRMRQEFS